MTTRRNEQLAVAVEPTAVTATEALREGAAAGAEAAANAWPAVSEALSRTVYRACYYTAYGATFAALSVASLMPKDSIVEKGFHDGAEAARETFQEREVAAPPTAEQASA